MSEISGNAHHTESVQALVLETLAAACSNGHAISLQSDLGEIGFDSVALSALIISAEAQYSVEFTYEHVLKMFQSTFIDDLARTIAMAILEYHGDRSAIA